jgi:GT2 family glycosyltransferase
MLAEMKGVFACIPYHNNFSTLPTVLKSVIDNGVSLENILVIDDGSSQKAFKVCEHFRIQFLENEDCMGRGHVRSQAISLCKKKFILFCDATNRLPKNFLQSSIKHFENDRVAAVSGKISNDIELSSLTSRWRGRHLFKESYNFGTEPKEASSLTTYGTLMRRDSVIEVGNFNQNLRHSEDRELGQRLISAGFKIIGDPNLVVYSIKKDSISSVLERYWRWYGGENESMSFGTYLKSIKGSFRPMIQQDINDCDWATALISFICPHYGYIRHLFRKITGKLQR